MNAPIDLVDQILLTAKELEHKLNSELRKHGFSLILFNVLKVISSEPTDMTMSAIKEKLGTGSDYTRLVDKLVKMNSVTRVKNEGDGNIKDRRCVKVAITSAGRKKVKALHVLIEKISAQHFNHLPQEKWSELNRILCKMQPQ